MRFVIGKCQSKSPNVTFIWFTIIAHDVRIESKGENAAINNRFRTFIDLYMSFTKLIVYTVKQINTWHWNNYTHFITSLQGCSSFSRYRLPAFQPLPSSEPTYPAESPLLALKDGFPLANCELVGKGCRIQQMCLKYWNSILHVLQSIFFNLTSNSIGLLTY